MVWYVVCFYFYFFFLVNEIYDDGVEVFTASNKISKKKKEQLGTGPSY